MKNNTKESWMYKYSLAKVYFEHHGNLEIPCSYKTICKMARLNTMYSIARRDIYCTT